MKHYTVTRQAQQYFSQYFPFYIQITCIIKCLIPITQKHVFTTQFCVCVIALHCYSIVKVKEIKGEKNNTLTMITLTYMAEKKSNKAINASGQWSAGHGPTMDTGVYVDSVSR